MTNRQPQIDRMEQELGEAYESLSRTRQRLELDSGLPGRGGALKAAATKTKKKIAILEQRIALYKRLQEKGA